MWSRNLILVGLLSAALPQLVAAHHGWRWTTGGNIELTGLITEARLGNPHGILTVDVNGEKSFQFKKVGDNELYLFPCGVKRSRSDGYFESRRFDAFLDNVRNSFDYVIFDSAPIGGFADTQSLCSKVDGVILVITYDKTRRQVALREDRHRPHHEVRLLGRVLVRHLTLVVVLGRDVAVVSARGCVARGDRCGLVSERPERVGDLRGDAGDHVVRADVVCLVLAVVDLAHVLLERALVERIGEDDGGAGARELAGELAEGGTVLLFGQLGVGKTAFVRGLLEGAGGVSDDVSSPTFTLIQHYDAPLPVVHIDLYRVSTREVDELGIDELASGRRLVAIEWADRLPRPMSDTTHVYIDDLGGDEREIRIERSRSTPTDSSALPS